MLSMPSDCAAECADSYSVTAEALLDIKGVSSELLWCASCPSAPPEPDETTGSSTKPRGAGWFPALLKARALVQGCFEHPLQSQS